MTLLNDEGYLLNCIKVFVKNFQMIKKGDNLKETIESVAVGKIKFLKLTIKRPVVSFIEGLSALSTKTYNSVGFSLSFLSIMGYDVAKLPQGIEKRCK